MNVSLTPELEELVSRKVASGLYTSASEVVREGLRLLREQDDLRELRREELRRDLQRGLDAAAAGNFVEYDAAASVAGLADEIKAAGRRRTTPKK